MDFNSITRFAGDHLSTAYNAIDNQLGGVLPGGVEADGRELVKKVVQDAMPGRNVSGSKLAEKAAANTEDAAAGRIDLVANRNRTGKIGARAREEAVEEGIEKLGKKAVKRFAKRGGFYAVPVVGQAVAIGDTVKDGMDAYDMLVTATTGKGFGQHVDQTMEMRNSRRGIDQLIPEANYVGDITQDHTIGQGQQENPLLQSIGNRATLFGQNFNPIKGDFGFSEVMGWN